jgi:hypothetical protein
MLKFSYEETDYFCYVLICILIYIQQDATLHSLFYPENTLHVSGGTITHHQELKTTVSTASGI